MIRVTTVNLSSDAAVADEFHESRELGDLSPANLQALLRSFLTIDPVHNQEHDPQIHATGPGGKLVIRTGQGRLFAYDPRDPASPATEGTVDQIVERLRGTSQSQGQAQSQAKDPAAPSSRPVAPRPTPPAAPPGTPSASAEPAKEGPALRWRILPGTPKPGTAPRERKPWSMGWIVLAIVLFVPSYTWLTLKYRKPGPAYQPYGDMKDRANVVRLLSAGYRRMDIGSLRPAGLGGGPAIPANDPAPIRSAPGGLPPLLRATLVDSPLLPDTLHGVAAAAQSTPSADYRIRFGCSLSDTDQQLSGARLYVREGEAVIIPEFERLPGSLRARVPEDTVLLTVPAQTFKPGRYRMTLAAEKASASWVLEVR